MIQRTPTYIGAKPETDPIANFFNNYLPASIAVRLNRLVKAGMYKQVKSVMSREEFDKHFTPPYNPWQQRFCLAPGGDFFKPIREGKASIVTDHIDHLTENGIQM